MSAKLLIGQQNGTAGHSKKLSKAEISNVNSKFLAGVKGTQGNNGNATQNMAGMLQTIQAKHAMYGGNPGPKSGEPRKLIKSTSHLQIGNGPSDSNKASVNQ